MANNTTGLSPSSPQDYTFFNTVLMSLKIVLIFVTIGGNAFTISAVIRFKSLRYPSNVMIAGLAMSDLLMGAVYTPVILIRANMLVLFENRTSCLAILFVAKSLLMGNVVFKSALSIERFYAVQFPYHYHSKVTVKHNLVWNIVEFAGVLCITIPVLCGIDLWSENLKCYSPILFPIVYSRVFIVTYMGFQLLGLSAFIRVLLAELSFRRRDRNLQMTEAQKQESVQSTIMVLAYGASLCLYMPHVVYYLWETMAKNTFDPVILNILQFLGMCSSAVNCFIYGFKNSKFREAYRRLLGFKSSRVESVSFTINGST